MQVSVSDAGIPLAEWSVQTGVPPWRAFQFACAGRMRAWKSNGRWYFDREDADRLAHELAAAGTRTAPAPQPTA